MASCSSSSASSLSPKKYDVFISFRGEDTRFNFTSHLHAALCRHNIETYIDYRLEKGDEVWPSLVKAIEDSTLFLIVFSENYASSTWCLNELTRILECSKDEGRQVIPVFYKIDPSHVRKQTGSYEIAFSKHEESNHQQHVHRWRAALTEAANLSGWDSSTIKDEAELIGLVVEGVLKKLDYMEQGVYLDGLVGIHEQIAHVESLVCNESQDVQFIGIWGIGGIGKTTIAKALFNKLCFAFDSFCFLDNVREETQKYGIVHLKNKLLSVLLQDKELYLGMPDGGSTYIQRRLGRKKVLLVLDDVNDIEQLRQLAGAHHWFGKGSRVIITTRDKQVLRKNVNNTYEVRELGFGDALLLFNLNAFKTNCHDKEFEQLSREVVVYAKGIPLALIVLGSCLCGKGKEEWKSQLRKLNKMPHPKIHKILKLSYDGLDHEEKNIFLDVACFFKWKQVEEIKLLLDACGYSTTIGLESLQEKSLLNVSRGIVSMHDLIQEMGLEIVREESLEDPGKRSRLWDAKDIYQVLKYNKGSDAIKGICLDMSEIKELDLSPQVFSKMQKLMFLKIYDSEMHSMHLPQGLGYLPDELRYLRWDGYPLKTLPLTFSGENLVQLEMPNSRLRKLWHGVQDVVNLRSINLSYSLHLTELPDLSMAINLEEVYLYDCVSLCEIHPSVFSLHKLHSLMLSGCVALASLKSSIHLTSLSCLYLDNCSNLMEFSVSSKNMRQLNLKGTAINELPSSMGQMLKLENLYLKNCASLKEVGTNLFGGLQSLRRLHLNGCRNIFEVIDRICKLSSLEQLLISNASMESLPASMKHLVSLRLLKLKKCKKLKSLSHLPPFIEALKVIDCLSLETMQFPSASLPPTPEFRLKITTIYRNCSKLNEHSIKATLVNYLLRLEQYLPVVYLLQLEEYSPFIRTSDGLCFFDEDYFAQVMYSGSRIPEWFKYKTTHASISVDLTSVPLPLDWTLLFCVVVSPNLSNKEIQIACAGIVRFINDRRVDKGDDCADANLEIFTSLFQETKHYIKHLTHDHVCLWCSNMVLSAIYSGVKEGIVTSNTKISLELNFGFEGEPHWEPDLETEVIDLEIEGIKGCGVCPTDASEYQNFIRELKMESEATASYGNNDEQEIVPSKHNSNNLIFPPRPTATWKNGTKGLKDIIHP